MTKSSATTYVFDADGVVCIAGSFSVALEREHGIPAERLATFFHGSFRACLTGKANLRTALAPHLNAWGWRGSVDELLDFWFSQENRVCPQVLAHVRGLRAAGHHCVLATNQEKHRTAYLRGAMGLGAEFDHIFASCEVGHVKPDTAYFKHIEHTLGAAPATLYLIDDSPGNVAAAHGLGWRALLYTGSQDIAKIG